MTGNNKPLGTDSHAALAEIVRMELVSMLHARMPGILLINLVVSILLAAAVWLQTQHIATWYWLMLLLSFQGYRYLSNRYWLPPAAGRPITRTTAHKYALHSGISGLLWGGCLLAFSPDTLTEMLPIALTLLGMMGGAIAALSYVWLAYLAYVLPVGIALVLGFFSMGGDVNIILGSMVIFYLGACFYFGIGFHRAMKETLLLRHEKTDLLRDLKMQKDLAERANIAKSRFLAAASHDLRQPLHTLALFIDALKESRNNEERNDLFPKIDLSLDTLSNLFNSLLDISKLDAGVIDPKTRDIKLSEVMEVVINEHQSEAKSKRLFLRTAGCDVLVRTDRLLMERILRNLISNAIRYTEKGGVLITCRPRNGAIRVQIWDTGVGIAKDKLDEIFLEFQQLNNPQRDRTQGMGLGLAIVRRLCRLLDHPLQVRSQPGKGTVFSVTLPKGSRTECENDKAIKTVHRWNLDRHVILVIDNECHILDAMQSLLSKWGCRVLTAQSLRNAIDLLDRMTLVPALILSDIRLADGEIGTQTLVALRERYGKEIPGLLITGDTAPEQIISARQSGFDVLHKPVKPALLRAAIYQKIKPRVSPAT